MVWFFFLAVIGAYILGNAEVSSQWIGWTVCSVSCLIWIFMGERSGYSKNSCKTYVFYYRGKSQL